MFGAMADGEIPGITGHDQGKSWAQCHRGINGKHSSVVQSGDGVTVVAHGG